MNFGWLQTLLGFLIIFTTLVFFHELGHFLFAKLMKMNVQEFAIGMGPRVVRLFNDGQTEYTIRAIPCGGFVRISGMDVEDEMERRLTGAGEKDQKHEREFVSTNVETMEQETSEVAGVDPNGFNSRPIWQRFLVILAGPVFSFLLGWITLCLIGVTTGVPDKEQLAIGKVQANSVAQAAGLKSGDVIQSIDNTPVEFEQALHTIQTSAGKTLTLVVRAQDPKDSPARTITATPRAEKDTITGTTVGRLGFEPQPFILSLRRTSLAESFRLGNLSTGLWFSMMQHIVASGKIGENVGGPVAMVKATAGATQRGGAEPLLLMGQLSLSLGLFNLLPIPILDGGHLLLMGVEAIRGRKLSAEQTGRVLTAGLAVLGLIFALVMFKDIKGLFMRG